MGREIEFNRQTIISISQDKFLSKDQNKKLIKLLCEQFEKENCTTLVAEEDADFLIVIAGEKCSLTWRTWLVGEDIDLLVILNKHKPYNTIYFLKPGKGNMRRFTSTVPARGARALNRAISNSCL